jgi:hypothetical protein
MNRLLFFFSCAWGDGFYFKVVLFSLRELFIGLLSSLQFNCNYNFGCLAAYFIIKLHVLMVRNILVVLRVVGYSPTQLINFTTVLFELLCTKGSVV